MKLVLRLLLRLARPYRKGDLLHPDGSPYMERRTLFESEFLSARLHHIVSRDRDPHMHDHPWNFLSVVLTGGYWEARPQHPLTPTFDDFGFEAFVAGSRLEAAA